MKKVLLLINLMTIWMTAGLMYATTPAPWGVTGTVGVTTFTWSTFILCTGLAEIGLPHANYYIGYDNTRKTSCIMIEYGSDSPRTQLWLFENQNPKLYNEIKNIIQNHLSGRKTYSNYYDDYNQLNFGFVANTDGLNIIQVVRTKNAYQQN